jgi:protein-S-isoprenylcysteine O-methyltransferase Ste14
VGHAELTGNGQLITRGLYTRVRHPRYLGMIAGVLGGCLLVGTQPMWMLGAVWILAALGSIQMEERELRARFGPAYSEYAQRVPFRVGSRSGYAAVK